MKKQKEVMKPVEFTPAQRLEQVQSWVKRRLEGSVESAKEVTVKIAADLTKSLGDAEYRLRWLSGSYKEIRMGQYCELALTEGLETAVNVVKARLNSWSPENSTSPYSNACNNEEFNALRDFLFSYEGYVKEIADLTKEVGA